MSLFNLFFEALHTYLTHGIQIDTNSYNLQNILLITENYMYGSSP